MSVPNPATTDWVPVFAGAAPGGAELTYEGDYSGATTYQDGDVVVKDGIAYLCVGGPTTVAPSISPWGQAALNVAGDELAYAEITANVTISATTEATANTIVTAPPVTLDGATPVIIDFNADYVGVGSALSVWLWDGGVVVGRMGLFIAAGLSLPGPMRVRITPSAGSHTYSIRAFQSGGNSTIYAAPLAPGSGAPVSIRIQRVVPSPPSYGAGALTPVTYGTSLPASPADGQEAILVDSLTAPTYSWRFRYTASITDAYKWVFVGGTPLFNEQTATIAIAAGSSYADYNGGTPTVTVPRAGDYFVRSSARFTTTSGTAELSMVTVKVGAAASTDNESVQFGDADSSAGSNTTQPFREMRMILAAGTVLKHQAKSVNGQSQQTARTLHVVPVRVA